MSTHSLSSAGGRISQHRKKKASDGSSRTVERRGRDKSTQRRNERWALTLCGTQKGGGQVRAANAGKRAIGAQNKKLEPDLHNTKRKVSFSKRQFKAPYYNSPRVMETQVCIT